MSAIVVNFNQAAAAVDYANVPGVPDMLDMLQQQREALQNPGQEAMQVEQEQEPAAAAPKKKKAVQRDLMSAEEWDGVSEWFNAANEEGGKDFHSTVLFARAKAGKRFLHNLEGLALEWFPDYPEGHEHEGQLNKKFPVAEIKDEKHRVRGMQDRVQAAITKKRLERVAAATKQATKGAVKCRKLSGDAGLEALLQAITDQANEEINDTYNLLSTEEKRAQYGEDKKARAAKRQELVDSRYQVLLRAEQAKRASKGKQAAGAESDDEE